MNEKSVDPKLAQQLESLLDADVNAKNAAEQRAVEKANSVAMNLADFETRKDSIIKPALMDIAALYESKGMFCRVEERPERDRPGGGVEPPQIGLDLAGPNYHDRTMKPAFTLSFDKQNRELSLRTSTDSQAGPGPKVALDEITGVWIHTEFLKYKSPNKPVSFGKIQTQY